jgi:hypothetical protein
MKKIYIISGCIQFFIALGAIPAGLGYLSDTTGVGMGTSVELLKNSPLTSFLIPALFLLIVHGFGNLFSAILSFRQKRLSGKTGLGLGLILCLWIIIQIYWIGLSSFMQPLFLLIGIAEALLGYLIIKKTA